jgi:hypothetical protein
VVKGHIQRLYDRRALYFNRKAISMGLHGTVTAEELVVLPLVCHYCGIGLTHSLTEFDHQIPFERGGSNTIDNIVRCCKHCNGTKFTKTPTEFLEFQEEPFLCIVCGRSFRPRYSDWKRGYGTTCSRKCAAKKRFL